MTKPSKLRSAGAVRERFILARSETISMPSSTAVPAGDAAITASVVISAFGAALGGLLFGLDTAVISGATAALQARFALSDLALGFTVASALIGTILGSLGAGAGADRLGRRPVMITIAALYIVSALGTGLAAGWPMLLAFRSLGGVAIGAASVVTPVYIAEVSPARFRGRLVALNQLNIVAGILLAFLCDYLIARAFPAGTAWRVMLGIVAVPSLLFLLTAVALPESPRWLASHGCVALALSVLRQLGSPDPDADLARITGSSGANAQPGSPRLFQRRYAFPASCAVSIALFNQLSGINALLYYAPRIFALGGAGADSALLQSVAVGGTNFVCTVLALFLIDRFGRRPLLMFGSVACAAALFVVGWQLHSARPDGTLILAGFLGFIAAFAVSQGAVIWVFISEVFPSSVRGKGQALGATTHWVMAAAVTWAFPVVAGAVGGWVFLAFAAAMLLQLVWVLRVMPETRGIPLEDMTALG
jgi:sugar porter (SP) family MFS transporter